MHYDGTSNIVTIISFTERKLSLIESPVLLIRMKVFVVRCYKKPSM